MSAQVFCQSCSMPIEDPELLGTESDGSSAKEYCTYCYQKGQFTQDVSLEEMIEICVPHMVKAGMPEPKAREMLTAALPNLSRWKKS